MSKSQVKRIAIQTGEDPTLAVLRAELARVTAERDALAAQVTRLQEASNAELEAARKVRLKRIEGLEACIRSTVDHIESCVSFADELEADDLLRLLRQGWKL